jgi:hypothetical protein
VPAPDRPALRRQLWDLHARLGRILEALQTTLPSFAGVVYQLRTRCGKRPCLCQEGKLHTAWCVSYREGPRRRLRTVPSKLLGPLRALAERYRRLRGHRAQINQTHSEMLKTFDRLERSLRVAPSRALRTTGPRRP